MAHGMILHPLRSLDGSKFDHFSTLKYLKSKLRRPSVVEQWTPYQIVLFEAAISEHGKEFHLIQKEIPTKTCREIIDFYYVWKKTEHYRTWKQNFNEQQQSEA